MYFKFWLGFKKFVLQESTSSEAFLVLARIPGGCGYFKSKAN